VPQVRPTRPGLPWGDPDFLPRSATNVRACGFHQGKPHAVRQRQQGLLEIRGKPYDRSCHSAKVKPYQGDLIGRR